MLKWDGDKRSPESLVKGEVKASWQLNYKFNRKWSQVKIWGITLRIQKSSFRPVRSDTKPQEIIRTLCQQQTDYSTNRCREGKRCEGFTLVVPIFAHIRDEGAQDKELSASFLEASTSFLPLSLPPSLSLLSSFPFSFPQIYMNYVFRIRAYAIDSGKTMLKKLTVHSPEA